jgi:LPXTG-motif cell wall-anchored protein
MGDFIGSTPFFIIMGVALAALIGLLIYLRSKPRDE